MAVPLTHESPPLRLDDDGVIRIGASRVPIDTVIGAFRDDLTAEEIVFQYPSLELGEVYAAIAHYLRHRDAVDEYLAGRAERAAAARSEAERRFDPDGIRARLRARR